MDKFVTTKFYYMKSTRIISFAIALPLILVYACGSKSKKSDTTTTDNKGTTTTTTTNNNSAGKAGTWKIIGKEGAWGGTIALTTMSNSLYSIESSGALYKTNLADGTWKQIGKPEFGNTKFMFNANGNIYTIEKNGSLYEVNAESGTWKGIGKPGAWKATIAGTVMNNALYTVESSGALYKTDLSSGKWAQIGKPEFGSTKFMVAGASN